MIPKTSDFEAGYKTFYDYCSAGNGWQLGFDL